MKKLALIAFLAIGCSLFAEDITTLEGEKHSGNIRRIDPDGIVLVTDSGIETIPFENLSPELQKKYGYDQAKAAAFKAQNDATTAAAQAQAHAAWMATQDAEMARAVALAKAQAAAAVPAPMLRHDTMLDTNRSREAGSTMLDAKGPLRDDKGSVVSIFGEVMQRTEDGMLVSARKLDHVDGHSQVTGYVWVTGGEANPGQDVKIIASRNGSYTVPYGGNTYDSYKIHSLRAGEQMKRTYAGHDKGEDL
jgi:hypothetical protein